MFSILRRKIEFVIRYSFIVFKDINENVIRVDTGF